MGVGQGNGMGRVAEGGGCLEPGDAAESVPHRI